MTRGKLGVLCGLAITTGIVGGFFAAQRLHTHAGIEGRVMPMWAHDYQSVQEMTRDVDAVVVATVLETRPGRTVSAGDEAYPLPFTLVDLEVEQVIRGEAGDLITMEQTGGEAGDTVYYVDGDGGPYVSGERVLLFLKAQPDTDYYYLAHPKGRFGVVDGVLQAVRRDDPVAASLHQRTVPAAVGILSRIEG